MRKVSKEEIELNRDNKEEFIQRLSKVTMEFVNELEIQREELEILSTEERRIKVNEIISEISKKVEVDNK